MGQTAASDTGRAVRVLSYERAVDAARRHFVERAAIDVNMLARDLSVGRATLFRVIRSQDRLLGDAIWWMSERTFALARSEVTATGIDRIVKTARRYNEYVVRFEPLRRFMRAEPIAAVRVLFTPAGNVHLRAVEQWKRFFVEIEAAGELRLPFDADDLAYVFIRIGESMLFSDLLAGREPNLDLAERVQRGLLRGSD